MIIDPNWMKVNRLSKEYENGVIQFLNFTKKKNFLTIMRFFGVLVKNVLTRKNIQGMLYSIIVDVMELFKIIRNRYGMVK